VSNGVCIIQPQHQTLPPPTSPSSSSSDRRSVRRHTTTPVTTHHAAAAAVVSGGGDVTMTSSSSSSSWCAAATLERAPAGGGGGAVSSPVLAAAASAASQLATAGSCRELRAAAGLPVVRSPNKSMERPLGQYSSLFFSDPPRLTAAAAVICSNSVTSLVAWHSGRTWVSGRRTFSVPRSTCG